MGVCMDPPKRGVLGGPLGGPGNAENHKFKMSRIGELLNTQKNVHFSGSGGPPGDPPGRGGPGGAPTGPLKLPPQNSLTHRVYPPNINTPPVDQRSGFA